MSNALTPVRRQYLSIKQRYPDAIVLFRLGDFYETFDDDAHLASRELDIVLTSREMGKGQRVPMAGVPAHALESYLSRLIKRGHKVAVCEQMSDPRASQGKGLVERDVVRVVTPGTVVEPSLLDHKANNYLAALVVQGDECGLAYVDISTGEYLATQLPLAALAPELDRISPAEVLVPADQDQQAPPGDFAVTPLTEPAFSRDYARQLLMDHFGVVSLEAFGCDGLPLAIAAAGAVLEYLVRTQRSSLGDLPPLSTYSLADYMALDRQTRRNLELFKGGLWDNSGPSLYSTLDLTRTSMGGRLLRQWLGRPLLDLDELTRRQDGVAYFHSNLLRRQSTATLLSRIGDMERALHRIRMGVAAPRELASLKVGLEASSGLQALLSDEDGSPITWLAGRVKPCDDVVALIDAAVAPAPGAGPGDGDVIREGFSPELDQLKIASRDARGYIAGLERQEREHTGIKGLKVGYNRVFGYYIEVSNPSLAQVPDAYVRRQTLVGGERFITPQLKEYESLILNAKDSIEELERSLFRQVCAQVAERAQAICNLAQGVAIIDVFCSLAEAASRYGYVRPQLGGSEGMEIKGGRHPVVERTLPPGSFVPNDTYLSAGDYQLAILTGPNMAGKSTYIRQVALIVLMAQMGSFVPADSATLGLVDRIFTRVGLQDDLATGKSTFMVEMVETAAILNQATPRSLVILDEIGRGTSTYDGLSIARSVVEYMHNSPRLGCKTLFATHYHELTQLSDTLPRVQNFTVAVAEDAGQVVFLHRIVPGRADRSYGVHVAQLAGLPRSVVTRAWEVLAELEGNGGREAAPKVGRPRRRSQGHQIPLFGEPSPLAEEMLAMDVSNLTPIQAINVLYELQQRAREASHSAHGA